MPFSGSAFSAASRGDVGAVASTSGLRVQDPGSAGTRRHQGADEGARERSTREVDGRQPVIVHHRDRDDGDVLGIVAEETGTGARPRGRAGDGLVEGGDDLDHAGTHRGNQDLRRVVVELEGLHRNRRIGRVGDRGRRRRHVHGNDQRQERETPHQAILSLKCEAIRRSAQWVHLTIYYTPFSFFVKQQYSFFVKKLYFKPF